MCQINSLIPLNVKMYDRKFEIADNKRLAESVRAMKVLLSACLFCIGGGKKTFSTSEIQPFSLLLVATTLLQAKCLLYLIILIDSPSGRTVSRLHFPAYENFLTTSKTSKT